MFMVCDHKICAIFLAVFAYFNCVSGRHGIKLTSDMKEHNNELSASLFFALFYLLAQPHALESSAQFLFLEQIDHIALILLKITAVVKSALYPPKRDAKYTDDQDAPRRTYEAHLYFFVARLIYP